MHKSSIFFASICFLLFGFSIKQSNIKIIEATSEKWTSGQNGSGSGTEYSIKIKVLSAEKIEFDTLWINNISLGTFLTQNSSAISSDPIKITKGETIIVRASDLGSANNKTAPPLAKYKGAGLLRYFVNGKAFYIVIKKFKPIQQTNRP